jgi:hypothetical protein
MCRKAIFGGTVTIKRDRSPIPRECGGDDGRHW